MAACTFTTEQCPFCLRPAPGCSLHGTLCELHALDGAPHTLPCTWLQPAWNKCVHPLPGLKQHACLHQRLQAALLEQNASPCNICLKCLAEPLVTSGATTRLRQLLLMGLLEHLQPHASKHGLVNCTCCHVCPRMSSPSQLQLSALSYSLQEPSTLPCLRGLSLQHRAYFVLATKPGRCHALSTMTALHALHTRGASTQRGPSA